jgi:hypothetical protein
VQRRSLFFLRIPLLDTTCFDLTGYLQVQVVMVKDSAAHCNAVFSPPIVVASGYSGYVGYVSLFRFISFIIYFLPLFFISSRVHLSFTFLFLLCLSFLSYFAYFEKLKGGL